MHLYLPSPEKHSKSIFRLPPRLFLRTSGKLFLCHAFFEKCCYLIVCPIAVREQAQQFFALHKRLKSPFFVVLWMYHHERRGALCKVCTSSPSGEKLAFKKDTLAQSNDVKLGRHRSREMVYAYRRKDARTAYRRADHPCRWDKRSGAARGKQKTDNHIKDVGFL